MENIKITVDIVYKSHAMNVCINRAKSIANSENGILIYGDHGTEKDILAHIIHRSQRRNKTSPFITINCSYTSDKSFQTELFGDSLNKSGVLQYIDYGTLYLEDISELSWNAQAMLVDVIKNRSFRRIGESEEKPINCKIICSSKNDLLSLVKENKFNIELYYLINVLPLNIPPLRKRKEDIKVLSEYFIDQHNQSFIYSGKKFLHPQTLKVLEYHDWPGNTVELKNVILRALHLSQGNSLKPKDITFTEVNFESKTISTSLKQQVQSFEKNIVEQTIKRYRSARKAAEILDVSHTTVLKKVKKYGLEDYIS